MSKLDSFENNSQAREFKEVPSNTYKVLFDKVDTRPTKKGFKQYSIFLKILDEGEYKGCFVFPSFLSGWATEKGEGNHLGQLRALLRVVVSQNLKNLKLKKFYDRIFKEDLEVEDFFEEILESNILTSTEFTVKVISNPGKPYIDGSGNMKEGRAQYSLDLSPAIEMKAIEAIEAK